MISYMYLRMVRDRRQHVNAKKPATFCLNRPSRVCFATTTFLINMSFVSFMFLHLPGDRVILPLIVYTACHIHAALAGSPPIVETLPHSSEHAALHCMQRRIPR
jgi:hypothetical protein